MNYLDTLNDDILLQISSYLEINDQTNLYFATRDDYYAKKLISNIFDRLQCKFCCNYNSVKCDACNKTVCEKCIVVFSPIREEYDVLKLCDNCLDNFDCHKCGNPKFDSVYNIKKCTGCHKIICNCCSKMWKCTKLCSLCQ